MTRSFGRGIWNGVGGEGKSDNMLVYNTVMFVVYIFIINRTNLRHLYTSFFNALGVVLKNLITVYSNTYLL